MKKMKKIAAIGELLIDFIPGQIGVSLKEVVDFKKAPGGAPGNVCAAVSKLGGSSMMISMLGEDAFGDTLVDTLQQVGVDTSLVLRTKKANTGLAFVSLKKDGEREFSFYRKPSADLLLSWEDLRSYDLSQIGLLHFGTVDLVNWPIKETTKKLIHKVKEQQGVISFDPNLRFPLWDNLEELKAVCQEFLGYADIVKISDDELEFIAGSSDIHAVKQDIFSKGCQLIVFTMGAKGAMLLTKEVEVSVPRIAVKAIDATGAGDSFIGSFLFQLQQEDFQLKNLTQTKLQKYLEFSNYYAAHTTTKYGAIDAMATFEELQAFIKGSKKI